MFVVALTRWGRGGGSAQPSLEDEVRALSPVVGRGAYELRLALASAPPVTLAQTEDLHAAKRILASLRGRGHGAVACDLGSVASSASMAIPREFRFEAQAFVGEVPGEGEARIEYAKIAALLPALHTSVSESSSEHTQKKFSLTRAALSGGVILTKKQTVREHETTQERERVAYVMSASGTGHLLLCESRLRYTGLGARIGRSSTENFTTTLAVLREYAPRAPFDDRLLRQKRSGGSLSIGGTVASRTVTASNDGEVDLAAHLLTVALLSGQT